MGLDLRAKGKETLTMPYSAFARLRRSIAKSYNKEIGEIYEKPYFDFGYKYSDEEINRWNKICNDNLDILLWHSDCEGIINYSECKKIYKALEQINFKSIYFQESNNIDEKRYKLLCEMLKHCADKRRTLFFC